MFGRLVRAGVFLLVAIIPTGSWAQDGSGTISGLVKDATGAVLPGSTVKVVNEQTGRTAEEVAGGQGEYRVTALAPGSYRVEAALDGFDTAVRRVVLEAGQAVMVELTLTVARF